MMRLNVVGNLPRWGKRRLVGALTGILLTLVLPARAQTVRTARTYETGYRQVARMESELFLALEPKWRKQVSSETVLLDQIRLPCLSSKPGADGGPGGPVGLSVGFVDFLNRLAHAKAYAEMEPGFFLRYTAKLGEEAHQAPVPEFDVLLPAKAWNLQTLNRQASFYNQMAGGLVAVDLAHHYLGHYRKHAAVLGTSTALPVPINSLISETEWREAVRCGAENALSCGLATGGLRAVFDCFEPMSPRPAWAAYFVHPQANVRRMAGDLAKQEREFFAMDGQPRRLTNGGDDDGR